MSDNPFDVFAADLKAAVPRTEEENSPPPAPINIMAQEAPAPVPVMKQPAMNAPPQQMAQPGMMGGMNGMGGGMGMNGMGAMGSPPPAMNGGYGMGMNSGMATGMGGMNNGMGGMNNGMGMYGQPPQQQHPPAMGGMMGSMPMGGMPAPAPTTAAPAPGSMVPVPAAEQTNPYAIPTPVPPSPAPPAYGMPAPAPAPVENGAFGMPPATTARAPEPAPVAPVPAPSADPFAVPAPVAPAAVTANPYDYGAPPPPVPPAPMPAPAPTGDPWMQPAATPAPTPAAAIVPAPVSNDDDPFGVFNTPAPAPVQSAPAPVPQQPPVPTLNDSLSVNTPAPPGAPVNYSQDQLLQAADGGNPWGDMGMGDFAASPAGGAPAPGAAAPTSSGGVLGGNDVLGGGATDALATTAGGAPGTHQKGDLPPGGEWYDARIFTPTLGVMFFKPQELTDSLFLQTERSLVEALDDRPVVAFIVEGSSARAAGVELGHVLLKVNGIDVKNPKEASRLIKEGPRPLPLLFYVPDTTVVVAEGEHMVKYDTRETGAPNSAKDWKPKYCVIGGIIAQPWMLNMYRSKSEYDIAVIETQARRPVSVKVKQFSLQGARIQNDWQGPQMVKYKNKLHPWKYIVVLPVSRNPIKISSPNLSQLKPVHEGIRRVLMAQQRHQGPSHSHGGPSDPYARGAPGGGGYGGPPPPQQQYGGPPPNQVGYGGPPPPQQYGGPPQGYEGRPPPQQQDQYGGYSGGNDYTQSAGGVGSARRKQAY